MKGREEYREARNAGKLRRAKLTRIKRLVVLALAQLRES